MHIFNAPECDSVDDIILHHIRGAGFTNDDIQFNLTVIYDPVTGATNVNEWVLRCGSGRDAAEIDDLFGWRSLFDDMDDQDDPGWMV